MKKYYINIKASHNFEVEAENLEQAFSKVPHIAEEELHSILYWDHWEAELDPSSPQGEQVD